MSAAEHRRWKAKQARELARELRRQDRERLRELRAALKKARDARRERLRELRTLCKAEKVRLREKARRLARELAETRAALRERRSSCSTSITSTSSATAANVKRARAALDEKAGEVRERRNIDRMGRKSRAADAKLATGRERRRDSDDTVRNDIPAELVPVWERVKRSVHGTDRMTRTEAFLQWVHDHSADVERMMYEGHARDVAALEAQERALSRASRKAARYSSRRGAAALTADLSDVPF